MESVLSNSWDFAATLANNTFIDAFFSCFSKHTNNAFVDPLVPLSTEVAEFVSYHVGFKVNRHPSI